MIKHFVVYVYSQFMGCLRCINIDIFCHLKLEIASAITATNQRNILRDNSAPQQLAITARGSTLDVRI